MKKYPISILEIWRKTSRCKNGKIKLEIPDNLAQKLLKHMSGVKDAGFKEIYIGTDEETE